MEPFSGKAHSASRPESVFIVKKLKYGGCELVLDRGRELESRHICDFRSEAEAQLWIRENAAKYTPSETDSEQ